MIDNLLLSQARAARTASLYTLETHRYGPNQMVTDEANRAEWGVFRERMNPLLSFSTASSGAEFIVTPKAVTWGPRDINIYAGHSTRKIETLADLTDFEGGMFLEVNLALASCIASIDGEETHVSIGFNPQDLHSPGNHSVNRLHSHIYVARGSDIEKRLKTTSWEELNWFKRLAFIEPFAPMFHEYIIHALNVIRSHGQFTHLPEPQANLGYTSFDFDTAEGLEVIFPDLRRLFIAMQAEHAVVTNLFTDGSIDALTGRLVPLPKSERIERVKQYLNDRQEIYSGQSRELLYCLAQNIMPATMGKKYQQIERSSDVWITRGFAGAFTFSLGTSGSVRLDFLPRVLTTSGVTKTIFGKSMPAYIEKSPQSASEDDQVCLSDYYREIIDIANHAFPQLVVNSRT